jgi:hypothetical protein
MGVIDALPRLIGRGALAGAIAGLMTGAFSFLLAEPIMDRAVRLESARAGAAHAGATADQHAEVFTRDTQHVGLLVATLVTGLALGVLFAVVYAVVHRRDLAGESWRHAMRLAGAALVGVWLLPFLRYPANPPGVGEEDTVGMRASAWLGAIVISLFVVAAAWRVYDRLAERPAPLRQGAVAGIGVAGLAVLFLLPNNPDPVEVPATLLWDFRLLAAATSLLLWTTLGAGFGLLGLRAAHQRASAPAHTAAIPS